MSSLGRIIRAPQQSTSPLSAAVDLEFKLLVAILLLVASVVALTNEATYHGGDLALRECSRRLLTRSQQNRQLNATPDSCNTDTGGACGSSWLDLCGWSRNVVCSTGTCAANRACDTPTTDPTIIMGGTTSPTIAAPTTAPAPCTDLSITSRWIGLNEP